MWHYHTYEAISSLDFGFQKKIRGFILSMFKIDGTLSFNGRYCYLCTQFY
jgi:hypothetical protein